MSKKISEMPEKLSMVDADHFTILDSADPSPTTKNKKVLRSTALSDRQPVAPAGNQLGVNGGWTAAGDSATRDVGTAAGDVAAGNAPASAVTGHESTYNHTNLPTTAQKGAMDAAAAPSGTNPFATMDDIPAGGSRLHADLTDTDTDGHPGTVITIAAGVQGNAVSIAADGSLQDSGVPPGGAGGTTDLSNTPSATEVTVESSSGQNTSIAAATQILAGVLSAADKTTLDAAVPDSRQINSGTGLSGGGDLSQDRTLALANTAVTPGAYTNADITVDAQGRLTAAANGSGGGGSGDSVVVNVTGNATALGLSLRDAVYLDGTWQQAQANSENTLNYGIVSAINGTSDFDVTQVGRVSGFAGLTPGQMYYLDQSTAGLATASRPSSGLAKTTGWALSATELMVVNVIAENLDAAGGTDLTDVEFPTYATFSGVQDLGANPGTVQFTTSNYAVCSTTTGPTLTFDGTSAPGIGMFTLVVNTDGSAPTVSGVTWVGQLPDWGTENLLNLYWDGTKWRGTQAKAV